MSDTVVSSETVVEDSVVAGLRRRLADLEFDLASARERYTEQHPEVVKLVAEISEVKANLSSAVARVVGTQVSTPNPQRTEILRQIAQAEVEITAARAQQEGLARLIEQEQVRLAQLPEKELDLPGSPVTWSWLRRSMRCCARRRRDACDGTDADLRHLPYRLRGDPEAPVKPRKLLNTAIAAVLGGFIGVGAALVLEFTDTSMKSADEIEKALSMPILGTIPLHVGEEAEQPRHRHTKHGSSTGLDSHGRKHEG